ncbi:MAG: hypothetical protein IKT16_10220 [Desulfovibrio sp.]|nr:hypothetical protein [Desulfovibrio sp.]
MLLFGDALEVPKALQAFHYHQERIANACEDIDSLVSTGRHAWVDEA